jgi:hypothetical protein
MKNTGFVFGGLALIAFATFEFSVGVQAQTLPINSNEATPVEQRPDSQQGAKNGVLRITTALLIAPVRMSFCIDNKANPTGVAISLPLDAKNQAAGTSQQGLILSVFEQIGKGQPTTPSEQILSRLSQSLANQPASAIRTACAGSVIPIDLTNPAQVQMMFRLLQEHLQQQP